MLTKTRVIEILQALRDRNIVVLGDVMLDEFVWGDVTRISPEAPVPVVDVRRESIHLGGAANVLANLVALGARGSVVGVIGNDEAGKRLRSGLCELGAGANHQLPPLPDELSQERRSTFGRSNARDHNHPRVFEQLLINLIDLDVPHLHQLFADIQPRRYRGQ